MVIRAYLKGAESPAQGEPERKRDVVAKFETLYEFGDRELLIHAIEVLYRRFLQGN